MPDRVAPKHFVLLTALVFLAVTVVFFWPVLLGGETLTGGDIVNQYLPYKKIVRDQLAQGCFPHWNPLTFSGRPLQADIQVGVFYPPNLVFWLLPLEWGFDLTTAFHFGLGAVGMALWIRRRTRQAPAAWLAGTLYAASGFATTRLSAGVVLFIDAMSWLPWMLLCWDRVLEAEKRSPRARSWAWVGLVVVCAMEILAGAPQIAFYSFLALGLYALVLAWGRGPFGADDMCDADSVDEDEEEGENVQGGGEKGFLPFRLKPMLWLAAAYLVAAGICAVQILPTLMFIGQSWDRAVGASWEYIVDGSLAPRDPIKLVAPFFFGDPLDEAHFWGGTAGYHETTAFMGAVPLFLLLLFCLVRWGRHRETWFSGMASGERRAARRFELFLLILLIGALVLAFGRHSPFFWLAYHVAPGFDRFRVPARLLLYVALSLSALSGWTLDRSMTLAAIPEETGEPTRSHPRLSVSRAAIALTILGVLALGAFWVCAPSLMRAFKMPFYPFESIAGHPLAGVASALESQARSSIAWFALSWIVAGLALAMIAASTGSRASRLRISLGAWAVVALAAVQILVFGRHFMTTAARADMADIEYPETSRIELLRRSLAEGERFLWFDSVLSYEVDQNQVELWTNRPAMYGLAQMRGYDPVNSRFYGLSMNQLTRAPLDQNPRGFMLISDMEPERIDWRLVGLWNCRIAFSYADLSNPAVDEVARWEFAPGQTLRAYRLKNPVGAAWFATPVPVPSDMSAFDAVRIQGNPEFAPDRMALVDRDAYRFAASEATLHPERSESVRLSAYTPNSQRFEVSTPKPAILVLSQNYYPGWRARVDGVAAPVLRSNVAQVGIPLAAGAHTVEVRYRPREFTQGAIVSVISLCLLALVARRIAGRERDEEVLFR
ncbi:YfhO family protein [Candidatus Sumerlaeota bacterium]|nr:YfhO family protein [Candidatus Sumerlaeota bacterium]